MSIALFTLRLVEPFCMKKKRECLTLPTKVGLVATYDTAPTWVFSLEMLAWGAIHNL